MKLGDSDEKECLNVNNSLFRCTFPIYLEKTGVSVVITLKIQTVIRQYWFKRVHESKENVVMVNRIDTTGWAQLKDDSDLLNFFLLS